MDRSLSIVETLGSVNVLCSVRPFIGGHLFFCVLICKQDKTGTLTQNKMHVEDIGIYDTTYNLSTLNEQLESSPPSVAENLRQLPTVSAICNAAAFEGSPSDSRRNVIGDATGEHNLRERRTYFSQPCFFELTRLGHFEIRG